ncbi:MAG: HlyD family secretion protein [Burkholderiales bacterium]
MKLPLSPYFAVALAVLVLAACTNQEPHGYQGYAEGEYVRVAAPFSGTLQVLSVKRGAQVKVGEPLFILEQENEAAARREAQQRLQNAEAQLANLQKGKRPTEIEAIRAQLAQAEAALTLSATQLKRQEQLVEQNFIARERLDEARAAHERDAQHVAELRAQVATARLAARPDEIRAAGHNVEAARAALAQAEWRLDQRSVEAPVAGLVQDTFYVAGEWVNANQPVVSLLPRENVKVRFFVEQRHLGAVKVGQKLAVACDGCAAPVSAEVSFISPQAEFTPPVIYSRQERAKLVFLIEARPAPDDAVKLHPGQPVEVKFVQ